MSAVAPRNVATGIEALLAVSNAPLSKPPGGAAPAAVASTLFPDLLGSIVDSAKGSPGSSAAQTKPGSNAAAKRPAQASKKSAGENTPEAIAAPVADPNQNLVPPSPCAARFENPWTPHDSTSLPAESSGSETGEAGDVSGAASRSAPAPAAADSRALTTPPNTGQPAVLSHDAAELTAQPGQTLAAAFPLPAVGEQWSGPTDRTGGGRLAVVLEQALETVPSRADAAAARDTGGAGTRSPRDLASAPPHGSASISTLSNLPALSPVERVPANAREAAGQKQDLAARRAAETRAADSAAAAYRVATDESSAAATFAGLDMPGGDSVIDPKHAPGRETDAGESASDRSLDATSLPGQGTLAFHALLVPAPAADSGSADSRSGEEAGASSGRQAAREAGGGLADGHSAVRSGRDENLNPQDNAQPIPASRVSQAEPAAHAFPGTAPAVSAAGAGRVAPPQGSSGHAASPAAPDLSAWEPTLQPHRSVAGGAAREIQLELRDADARVNVRLVERAGAVQVDVRTPDSHLASSLRQDLPTLASRLEQTGLRAETWHDAPAAAATRIRTAEPGAGAGFQSSQNPSREGGGNNPRDGQPKEKQQKQNQPQSKEFSWLYTSLQ